jgi:hypothetical protein
MKNMKKLELKNDDFLGYVNTLRHACRGILVKDGKVLLGYESKNNHQPRRRATGYGVLIRYCSRI